MEAFQAPVQEQISFDMLTQIKKRKEKKSRDQRHNNIS